MTALSFTRCYATPYGAINIDYKVRYAHPNSLRELSIIADIKLNSVPNLLGGVQLNKMEETKWK